MIGIHLSSHRRPLLQAPYAGLWPRRHVPPSLQARRRKLSSVSIRISVRSLISRNAHLPLDLMAYEKARTSARFLEDRGLLLVYGAEPPCSRFIPFRN